MKDSIPMVARLIATGALFSTASMLSNLQEAHWVLLGGGLMGITGNYWTELATMSGQKILGLLKKSPGVPPNALAEAFSQALTKTLRHLFGGKPLAEFRKVEREAWNTLHPYLRQAIETWFRELDNSANQEVSFEIDDAFHMALLVSNQAEAASQLEEMLRKSLSNCLAGYKIDAQAEQAASVFVEWVVADLGTTFELFFLAEIKPDSNGAMRPAWVEYDTLFKNEIQRQVKTLGRQGAENQALLEMILERQCLLGSAPNGLTTVVNSRVTQVLSERAQRISDLTNKLVAISRKLDRIISSQQQVLFALLSGAIVMFVAALFAAYHIYESREDRGAFEPLDRDISRAFIEVAQAVTKEGKEITDLSKDDYRSRMAKAVPMQLDQYLALANEYAKSAQSTSRAVGFMMLGEFDRSSRLLWEIGQSLEGRKVNSESDRLAKIHQMQGQNLLARGDLREAVKLYQASIAQLPSTGHELARVVLLDGLGWASYQLGCGCLPKEGNSLIQQAITAWNAAILVCPRDTHPIEWSRIKNRIGIALATQGERTKGQKAIELFESAIKEHTAAQEAQPQGLYPVAWAKCQTNISEELRELAARISGEKTLELVKQSVQKQEQAMDALGLEEGTELWADMQIKLANCYDALGQRGDRAAHFNLMKQIENCALLALPVYEAKQNLTGMLLARSNLHYAKARINANDKDNAQAVEEIEQSVRVTEARLALCEGSDRAMLRAKLLFGLGCDLAEKIAFKNANASDLAKESIGRLSEALMIFDPESTPMNWIEAKFKLGKVKQIWSGLVPSDSEFSELEKAAAEFQDVLAYMSPQFESELWARCKLAHANILLIMGRKASGDLKFKLLCESKEAYQNAEIVFTRESWIQHWGSIEVQLGNIIKEIAEINNERSKEKGGREEGTNLCKNSILHFINTLDLYKYDTEYWGAANESLGWLFEMLLHIGGSDAEMAEWLAQARRYYFDALTVRTRIARPVDWANIHFRLGIASELYGIYSHDNDSRAALQDGIDNVGMALEGIKIQDDIRLYVSRTGKLGQIYLELATRTEGSDRSRLLKKAAFFLKDAMSVAESNGITGEYPELSAELGGLKNLLNSIK